MSQAAGTPSVWPYSGRGERRPQTARAARTNDPLRLPDELNGQSTRARRWRDLANHYRTQFGTDQMKREDVRARLRSLIWLTIEIERLHDERLCNQQAGPALHTLLHMTQEQRVLIAELGLSTPARDSVDLNAHIARRTEEAAR